MDAAHRVTLPPPPSRVWFGAHEYRVVPVEEGDRRLDGAEYGITYFDEEEEHGERFTIYFVFERPAREVFDTVWHELTHALNYSQGVRCKSRSVRKNDEHVATRHGYAWTQAFLDNPKLVAWIDLAATFIKSEQESIEA